MKIRQTKPRKRRKILLYASEKNAEEVAKMDGGEIKTLGELIEKDYERREIKTTLSRILS